ncbi:hypothetical protein N5C38_03200 [Pseudomonas chengduensis]|nr:hypothetical protein [Pseudomonas chengduensis]MDH1210061.1 hypothetical protein [Pseudomonas chengduensis]
MKTKLTLTALALSILTTSAFALPSSAPAPLAGEAKDNSQQSSILSTLADGGSDRVIERMIDRNKSNVVADGGSDRVIERMIERNNANLVADGGSDRVIDRMIDRNKSNVVADGGSDRVIERMIERNKVV